MSTDQIVFEDTNEQYGFTHLPNAVLTSTVLNPTEVRIYGILRRYASMSKGAMPSIPTICLEANISKTTYGRAIKTFILSPQNPAPKIPLITSVRRPNQTSVFKIHKLTDRLVDKLKPAVAMEKDDREQLKEKYKSKKENTGKVQNEPSIENTGKVHFEPYSGKFKMNLWSGSNRTISNKELNNIEQQQQEHQKNVVVVLDEFKKSFEKKITEKQAEDLIKLAIENDKDVLDAIQETMMYYKQSGEEKKNPFGAVKYSLTTGWDVEDATKQGNASAGVNRPTQADIERQEAVEDKMRRIMLERKQQREGAHHGA